MKAGLAYVVGFAYMSPSFSLGDMRKLGLGYLKDSRMQGLRIPMIDVLVFWNDWPIFMFYLSFRELSHPYIENVQANRITSCALTLVTLLYSCCPACLSLLAILCSGSHIKIRTSPLHSVNFVFFFLTTPTSPLHQAGGYTRDLRPALAPVIPAFVFSCAFSSLLRPTRPGALCQIASKLRDGRQSHQSTSICSSWTQYDR